MEIPRELSELGLRLEQWRSQRQGSERLPEEFWEEAAKLGERHGFARVANVLRVNATVLRGKRRADEIALPPARSRDSPPDPPSPRPPRFRDHGERFGRVDGVVDRFWPRWWCSCPWRQQHRMPLFV